MLGSSVVPRPNLSSSLDFVRVLTCGSVDDGKSTLIGRLLYDLGSLTEDQVQDLGPSRGDPLDFSLVLDGLAAEREQGITIDVAYRSFSSPQRRFLIADVPGHEQYTRNMVTGASTADLALIVIDAKNGLLTQTRRHIYLAWLLGIRCFVLAVNKMDLLGFDQDAFGRIEAEYERFLGQLGPTDHRAIPVSARFGDNVVERSARIAWFCGPTLNQALHEMHIEDQRLTRPFRLPVQWVNRSMENGRGYSGTVMGGRIQVGEEIKVQPSGQPARVAGILTSEGWAETGVVGQAITLKLDKELDIGRGYLVSGAHGAPACGDALEATLIWMSEQPLVRGRSYSLKIGTKTVAGQIMRVHGKVELETMTLVTAEPLAVNEVCQCSVSLDEPVAFDVYDENRDTGGFIVIDRLSNDTIAAGLIRSGQMKFRDIPWQSIEVTKLSRASLNQHPPAVLWFTGISGAGKSTIANLVEKALHVKQRHTYLLDGDNIRHGLTRDLGFSDSDRVENVRRVTEVARLMADAGLIVLVALISPFRAERRTARERIGDEDFVEIFVDTPLEMAEARDVKGLYKRARLGNLDGFTGIDSTYERPEHAELHIETTSLSAEEAAERIVGYLERRHGRAHSGT